MMMYDVFMHRTQLMFEEWQYDQLQAIAECEVKVNAREAKPSLGPITPIKPKPSKPSLPKRDSGKTKDKSKATMLKTR